MIPHKRPRILLTGELEAGALAEYKAQAELIRLITPDHNSLIKALADCDAAVTRPTDRLNAEDFAELKGSRLKIIANHAVGYENLDLAAARQAGIWVSNTPDVLTQTTAELAWALLLAVARRLVEGDQLVRSGSWTGWEPNQLLGTSVFGKRLGIVGAGRIGQAMARIGKGFGVELLYYSPNRKPEFEAETQARYLTLPEIFAEADLISLHMPGGPETRHLITAELLSSVKPGCLLVNTGRGAAVSEQALIQALKHGTLAGAALDVYEFEPQVSAELRALSNVVLAPHIGSATVETRRNMALMCLKNIQLALAGKQPPQALFNLA